MALLNRTALLVLQLMETADTQSLDHSVINSESVAGSFSNMVSQTS